MPIKPSEVTCLFVDQGLFVELAATLAKTYKKVYYYVPSETAFPKMNTAWIGRGVLGLEVVDSPFGDFFDEVDLVVFPDVNFGPMQLHMESLGKKVWGSRMGEQMELDRVGMKEEMRARGLPVGKYRVVKGMDGLRTHLQERKNQHVKISKFRGCFDPETEILTDSGWRHFDGLTNADKVASMDPTLRNLEFKKPSAIIKYWHSGKMVSIKGRSIDALVTPNHGLWARSGISAKWAYRPIFSLLGTNFQIPATSKWAGAERESYPLLSAYSGPRRDGQRLNRDRALKMDDWLEFLGWFTSEGCTIAPREHRKIYRVCVSQSKGANPSKYAAIKSCMERLGFNIQIEGAIGFSVYDKALHRELDSICYAADDGGRGCYRKRVPAFIKDLSPRQINIFLDAYTAGDGSREVRASGKETVRFWTSSKLLADDLQELLVRVGKSSSIAVRKQRSSPAKINGRLIDNSRANYVVNSRTNDSFQVLPANTSFVEHYEGFVHCVTVEPYHSILVRRNGMQFWSGNSFETFFAPDYKFVEPKLDEVENSLGAFKHVAEFVVEDDLADKVEYGIDAYCIDGKFPKKLLSGLEIKDQGFVGVFKNYADLPEVFTRFDKVMAPLLKQYGYRGFYSTEVRVGKDMTPYMIDFCARAASPPNELYQVLYKNLAEIIWAGANGECIDPVPLGQYGAEALIHSSWADKGWQPLDIPADVKPYVKLRNATFINGKWYVIPQAVGLPEIGAVIGYGSSLKEAIAMVTKIADQIRGYYVEVKTDSFDKADEEIAMMDKLGLNVFA
jgi:hypothetical protein